MNDESAWFSFSKFSPVYFSEEIHEILLTQWEYGIYIQIFIYGKNETHGAIWMALLTF